MKKLKNVPMVLLIYLAVMCPITIAQLDWAVHLNGGIEAANALAKKHSMKNIGEIIPDTNYFLLRTVHSSSRERRSISDFADIFESETQVDWAEYQARTG